MPHYTTSHDPTQNYNILAIIGTTYALLRKAFFFFQVNRERVGTLTLASEGGYRDVAMLQECDDAVNKICELCGWSKTFEKMMTQPGEAAGHGKSVGQIEKSKKERSSSKVTVKSADHTHSSQHPK